MKFPVDYPYSPPSVRFLSKMWHPNVYEVSCFLNIVVAWLCIERYIVHAEFLLVKNDKEITEIN